LEVKEDDDRKVAKVEVVDIAIEDHCSREMKG
jgi:hypothetical protein